MSNVMNVENNVETNVENSTNGKKQIPLREFVRTVQTCDTIKEVCDKLDLTTSAVTQRIKRLNQDIVRSNNAHPDEKPLPLLKQLKHGQRGRKGNSFELRNIIMDLME